MEEKRQNQEKELASLKAKYKTLREKINQQEIVTNDLLHEMLHSRIRDFRRRNGEIVLTYGLMIAAVGWSGYCFGLGVPFLALSVLLFLLLGLVELFACRRVQRINTSDADVRSLIREIRGVQTRFSLVWSAGVLALCLWMMWFVTELGDKKISVGLHPSFVIMAAILTVSVVLTLGHLDRLTKMSGELIALSERLNGDEVAETPTIRRGKAFMAGIVLVVLSIVGLIFKLLHLPFANLIYFVAVTTGVVFVLLTGSHLSRIVADQRQAVRIATLASLLLVANAAFRLFHWPFDTLFGVISLLLFLFVLGVYVLRRGHRSLPRQRAATGADDSDGMAESL